MSTRKRTRELCVLLISLIATSSQVFAEAEGSMAASMGVPSLSEDRIREIIKPEKNVNQNFWKGRAEGWWWYHDPELEQDDFSKVDPKLIVVSLDNAKTVKETKEIWQAALETSLIQPTRNNVLRMMYAKQWFMERGEVFANVVQRARWQTTELDYSLIRPVNTSAINTYKVEREKENNANMLGLAQEGAGIFFFMSSTCPYCAAMAPTMQAIQNEYGIQVMAITIDGQGLPEFPQARADNGIGERLGLDTVPAYYLVTPEDDQIVPIGAGVLTKTEIVERVYSLTQRRHGESR